MKKLYYEDIYLKEWKSNIDEIFEENNKYLVVLSETAFYPESGGQPSDRGEIDGIKVIGVIEKAGVIYHILNSKPQRSKVLCKLDFDRRFDYMQQHTGQHLFSAVFYKYYRGETSNFHIGDDYVYTDISISNIPPSMAKDVENIANEYILKNINVITHVISPNEINKYPVRKLPPNKKTIRIIEIDKLDFSPCCGTHVTKTGEIGIIKILKTEKHKNSTRIYLKCGNRGLSDFQNKTDLIIKSGKFFSIPESEILAKVKTDSVEINNLTKQLSLIKEMLFVYESDEIIKITNSNFISMEFDKPFNDVLVLAKHILRKKDSLLLLSSSLEQKVLLCHNGKIKIDCGKLLKEYLTKFNGRGGGNFKQSQAVFECGENMNKFIDFLKEMIE